MWALLGALSPSRDLAYAAPFVDPPPNPVATMPAAPKSPVALGAKPTTVKNPFDNGGIAPIQKVPGTLTPTPAKPPEPAPASATPAAKPLPPNVAEWQDAPRGTKPAPAPPNAAEWQDAPRRDRAEASPAAKAAAAATATAAEAQGALRKEDLERKGSSMKTDAQTATTTYTRQHADPKGATQTAVQASASTANVGIARRRATEVTDDGKVHAGAAASATAGKDGLAGNLSTTKGGVTTGVGAQYGPNGQTVRFSHGTSTKSKSLSVTTKDGTTTMAGSMTSGGLSASAGIQVTDRLTRAGLGKEGIDATIRDFVGDGTYVERETGHTGFGGLDVQKGMWGAGGSGYKGASSKTRHFNAGNSADVDKTSLPAHLVVPELDGIEGVGDVDLAKLAPGEGYSFERGKMKGIEGHVKVGITMGLGHDDAELSQAVLARDAKGDLRVMLSQGDTEALTGSLSLGNEKGTMASLSQKETMSKNASVSFTAHGPEGEKAVREFQRTGLLPGADRVAKAASPDAVKDFEEARKKWEEAKKGAPDAVGLDAVRATYELHKLHDEMCSAAGKVNQAFLENARGSLDDAGVAGVTYDEHTAMRQKESETSLSTFGLSLLSSGSKEMEWDKGYRDENRKAQLEQGYGREDSWAFSKTDTSQLVMNPKGYAKDGDAVALVMGGKQGMTAREREIVARVGPAALDMPPEAVEAYRKGEIDDTELTNVAVTMTESQLATIRDKLAAPDLGHLGIMRPAARAIHDRVANGGRKSTLAQATSVMGGSDAAKADVELNARLDKLFEDAAAARARKIVAGGGEVQNLNFLESDGMEEMLDSLDKVKTAQDFTRLTPEEQKLYLTMSADQLTMLGQSPYETMRLALQVKDVAQRNALVRQVFEIDEARVKGADSALNFVEWVQNNGAAAGMSKEEMSKLLSGVAVRPDDMAQERAAVCDSYNKVAPGLGNRMIGHELASSTTGAKSVDAHRITKLLQAARGDGRDPKAVELALATALESKPELWNEMWDALAGDPVRVARVKYMLKGTRYEGRASEMTADGKVVLKDILAHR